MLTTVALLAAMASGSAGEDGCYRYGSALKLPGTLTERTFAGPPNYDSVAEGDRPEKVLVLHLATPMCTKADNNDAIDAPVAKATDVQLVFTGDAAARYRHLQPLLGSLVQCQGTLLSAISGHHHTPVLMQAASCRLVD